MITGAILAGGFGTRLRPVLSNIPKVLAPVGGRPFLTYLLEQLSAAGVRKVVLCTGYLAEQIRAVVGHRYGDLQILYSQENQPVGTAGALRLAHPLLESDPVLAMNGDSYCDLDLPAFLSWHRQKEALASLALVHMQDTARFGRVSFEAGGAILRFGEKESKGAGWINAGIYLLSQGLLRTIPEQSNVSMEYEVFPRFVGKGLFGYPQGRRFLDIGTPASYAEAENVLLGSGQKDEPEPLVPLGSATSVDQRFVLLDRDGTINVERHYLSDPEQFELLPGALEGLKRLHSAGLGLVVVSNQSAVGRGYLDQDRLEAIHQRMKELLEKEGIILKGVYICPHQPDDQCACRKPGIGLGRRAAAELGFDPKHSFVIGDKETDIVFGKHLGARTLLVLTGYGKEVERRGQHGADYIVDDLSEAASVIIRRLGSDDEKIANTIEMVRK
jgi:D-glycero-alpha-D-manno-heptose 1-phosphate guanylyltransferase